MSLDVIKYKTEFNRYNDEAVITAPIGNDFNLNNYSTEFKPEGIELYDVGKAMKMNRGLKKAILEAGN